MQAFGGLRSVTQGPTRFPEEQVVLRKPALFLR